MNKILFIILFLTMMKGYGQIRITGQVIDSHNRPISLALVDLVGMNISSTSDDSGVFFINLTGKTKLGEVITLRVSKPEYKVTTLHTTVSYLSIPIKLIKSIKTKSQKQVIPSLTKPVDNQIKSYIVENQPLNVTSNFQSGGITAGQIIITPPARKLNENNTAQILLNLPDKNEKIDITSLLGDSEAFQFAMQISNLLKTNGYKNVDGVNQAIFNSPVTGQSLFRDSLGVKIIIGSRQ